MTKKPIFSYWHIDMLITHDQKNIIFQKEYLHVDLPWQKHVFSLWNIDMLLPHDLKLIKNLKHNKTILNNLKQNIKKHKKNI